MGYILHVSRERLTEHNSRRAGRRATRDSSTPFQGTHCIHVEFCLVTQTCNNFSRRGTLRIHFNLENPLVFSFWLCASTLLFPSWGDEVALETVFQRKCLSSSESQPYLSNVFTLDTSCQGRRTFACEVKSCRKTPKMRFKTHMLKESKRILLQKKYQTMLVAASL